MASKKKNKKKTSKKRRDLKKIKVRVVGVGGGGGSVVDELSQAVKKASFYAVNSDSRALKSLSRKVSKLQLGKELTGGLGTGMNPELGGKAAESEKEKIKKMLEGQDFVILVSCLGGGLGSGASPVIAKISKKSLGNLTYGIFTLPFKFEGKKKMSIAKKALKKLKREVDAFSVIPNQRIFQVIDKDTPLNKALSAINNQLADSLQSLIEIIYKPGLINIDFADLKAVFRSRGRWAYLNSVDLGKSDEEEIVKTVINSPLYPYSINGAKGVLFNITGRKSLSLSQVNKISNIISKRASRRARVIFGVSKAKRGFKKVRVSLLATGCKVEGFWKGMRKEFICPKCGRKLKSKSGLVLHKRACDGGKKKDKETPKKKKGTEKKKGKKKSAKKKKKGKKKKPKAQKVEVKKVALETPKKKEDQETQEEKIRKNGLQLKKEKEKEEAEIISKEKFWEAPAFLRKDKGQ
ncbi:MAG: cell division protein FtsZ [Candidatus Nealsonbacteria bacterium]|nr:cell division protein FtsZ [Candidatus Nealsonbacteria bacterium]